MRHRQAVALALFSAFLIGFSAPAGAYWVDNGIVVCDAAGEQTPVAIVADGEGGAIIVWEDYSGVDPCLYAQKVNERGETQWAEGGVLLEEFNSAASGIRCISDGAGGIYLAHMYSLDRIFLLKLESNGVSPWLRIVTSGVATSAASPDLALDGAGGVIVCWRDDRNGNYDIFARRYRGNGETPWGSYVASVCTQTSNQTGPRITSLGSDAVIFWADYRNPTAPDIYAQKIDTTGTCLWASNGLAVCTESGEQAEYDVTTDNSGNAVIVWRDTRNGNYDIYAQSVDPSGILDWTSAGVPVCTTAVAQRYPRLVAHGPGGVIITWQDQSGKASDYDIFAQYIEGHGDPMWNANGRVVCSAAGDQTDPRIIATESDRAIIAWVDRRNVVNDYEVYAQQVDGNGDPRWTPGGTPITDLGDQRLAEITTDGAGGAIVAWNDRRIEYEEDIRAQRIFLDGRTGDPRPTMREVNDIDLDEGGYLRIGLRASDRDLAGIPAPQINLYNVWRKIEPLAAGPYPGAPAPEPRPREELLAMAADPDLAPGLRLRPAEAAALGFPPGSWESAGLHAAMQQGVYLFIVPTRQDSSQSGTHWETFVVSAHTIDPGLYFVSFPDSGYSVDNVAPVPPMGLAGEQTYDPAGLRLTWVPNTEDDLWYYGVHRDTDAGFEPGPGNLVATPIWSEWFDTGWTWDGGYWYKISAVDRHGNESTFAVLGPGMVTGDEPSPTPDATFLAQNRPNPFNPSTTIRFTLDTERYVDLRVYDVTGREVDRLVERRMEAGSHAVAWQPKRLSSGVYLYVLRAGDITLSGKAVLMR